MRSSRSLTPLVVGDKAFYRVPMTRTAPESTNVSTIFALASGKGRAGVAVIRISGPMAGGGICALTGRELPPPRQAVLRELRDPVSGDALDQALVLWFPAPESFTGEDVAELHVHGGRAVVSAVYRVLGDMADLRIAESGEFSLRAFHHGRIDLTEAEGMNDLVLAETEAQRVQALRQLGGELGRQYESWRKRLIEALACFEAAIDFSDEELPDDVTDRAVGAVRDVLRDMEGHLQDGRRGERIRSGFEIVILGAPNVGKSSLLNALAKADVAIVSEIAGTTRDIVQVRLDLGGYMVELSDTAGLREASESIEAEGVRRALARAGDAALKLLVVSAADDSMEIPAELQAHLGPDTLIVANKCDLMPRADGLAGSLAAGAKDGWFVLSATTGEGVGTLLSALEREVVLRLSDVDEVSLTRARHRSALDACCRALEEALAVTLSEGEGRPLELIAENLRIGTRALGQITGRVDVEAILDVVFSEFCIGK